jgi:hypothetical protein
MYLDTNSQKPDATHSSVPNPREEFMKQLEAALIAAKRIGTNMIILDPEMYQDYDSGWVDNIVGGYVTKFQEDFQRCGVHLPGAYCQYINSEFSNASDTTQVDGNRVREWVINRLYAVGKEMAQIIHRFLPNARILTTFTGFDKNLVFTGDKVFVKFSSNYAPALIFEGMLKEAQSDPKYIFELVDGSERPVDYPHFSLLDIRSKLDLQERYIKPITDLYGTKTLKLGAPIVLWRDFRTDVLKCHTNETNERNCPGWSDRFNKERLKYLKSKGAKVTHNKVEDAVDILCELFSRREYVWIYGPKRMKYH